MCSVQTFTADELRTALSGVMSSLNISAGPPSKPVTPEDFKAAFAAAVGNLRRVCAIIIFKKRMYCLSVVAASQRMKVLPPLSTKWVQGVFGTGC